MLSKAASTPDLTAGAWLYCGCSCAENVADSNSSSTYWSVTLLDSILAHDVEDAVPDGIPIPPPPGGPSHSQSSKKTTLGIPTGPCLHQKCRFNHAYYVPIALFQCICTVSSNCISDVCKLFIKV